VSGTHGYGTGESMSETSPGVPSVDQRDSEPALNGPRWEYARFLYQDPTTVYFTHREGTWTKPLAWQALYLLGEYGFELVTVTQSVGLYEGEQQPASRNDMALPTGGRTQFLEATRVETLYVLKRNVDPSEPECLPNLPDMSRREHRYQVFEEEMEEKYGHLPPDDYEEIWEEEHQKLFGEEGIQERRFGEYFPV
jgi:hypothetical protein